MSVIAVSVLIVCACGLLAGVGLAIAARVFAVTVDPRIEKVEAVLPGANCSGCGSPSCFVYASRIVNEGATPNLCVQLREEGACEIGRLIGREVVVRERQVAVVRCYGGPVSKKLFAYGGFQSCRIAAYYSGGGNACEYNCMAFGDCFQICQFGAISHTRGLTPRIDPQVCTGCGKCVRECPRHIIRLVQASARAHVACSSRDKGSVVRAVCTVGCIKCLKCVKVCPHNAIAHKDGRIEIDYSLCTACGECIRICPRGIIIDLQERYTVEAMPG
jgi:Na+-translocating ferredoxin:NAD+ oxidoreductase RNF subunit RnfB